VQAFLEGERLEDSESWSCKSCKKMVQAHKKLDLWSLPEVLVIHLKRFSYSYRFRDKIDALVNFPLEALNLSNATLKKQVAFFLFASPYPPAARSATTHAVYGT
jgi:ubiquitin C-terminal hydrolase